MQPHRRAVGATLCLALAAITAPLPFAAEADAGKGDQTKPKCEYTGAERSAAARAMAAVKASVPELMERHDVPGASVALIADGRPRWTSGYGWSVPAKRIPVSPDTVFQAGSMTVPITAWTVLHLVERGKIDLDKPVDGFLKGRDLPPSGFDASRVTPRLVLSHRAGLSIPAYDGFGPKQTMQTLDQSLRGAIDAGNQPVQIISEPGVRFEYSAGGYALAELMVRQMANEQFSRVAYRQILQRLDMFRSSLPDRPDASPPLAVTYDDAGQPAPARGFSALGAAGLQTTAPDYAQFVSALMPGPCSEPVGRSLITPEQARLSRQPQPFTENDLVFADSRYGLGLALKTLESGNTLVYHPGDNPPNWHGIFAAIPERQSGIVLLTSAVGGRDMGVTLVCRWLDALGETPPSECPSPEDGPKDEAKDVEG